MRNEPKPLSPEDYTRQMDNRDVLVDVDGDVTIHYVKRNGEQSSSTGTVAFFNGRPGFDTGSVTIADPVKGNRTINLHRIFTIE
jgi:hypothetical protein